MKYLLDSNVIIDYLAENLPLKGKTFISDVINEDFLISIITHIEVLGFNSGSLSTDKQTRFFIDLATICYLNDKVASETINIRRVLKLKLPDAIIAATALANNFTLVSRNTKDFKNIQGLQLIDPYSI